MFGECHFDFGMLKSKEDVITAVRQLFTIHNLVVCQETQLSNSDQPALFI